MGTFFNLFLSCFDSSLIVLGSLSDHLLMVCELVWARLL
jgi:hypothetical protein